ncbi:hypothetical protein [Lentibacillus salicampi]|uniref:Uncharacterized protein n=1 Tax=Lentibacillus salicampi TaxID=175306 RepID=A0A4Y9ABH2_9BACI|nr:hypothetical protein [Lentibacillus salicampi]TFJ91714.1 hypothetical protein E4U82_16085 [Lentibacillus salicampi]
MCKQKSLLGGGPFGTKPSYSFVGSDEEKNKHNLIEEIYQEIVEYDQWVAYFTELEEKDYLNLCLSNSGTHYDEDVDVKLFVREGKLCGREDLPLPGNDILKSSEQMLDAIYKPKKSVSVKEYEDYPVSTPEFENRLNYGLIYGQSHEELIANNKKQFLDSLADIYYYEHFREDGYDVICYKQPYIKQNTSVFFPSLLVFNFAPDTIKYEISSKYSPKIVKGEIQVKK